MWNRYGDFGLVYLATVYSAHPEGIDAAYVQAAELAGRMLKKGYRVYSPIAHTHPIAIHGQINPYDHNVWLPFDQTMMEKADCLVVAPMPGWRDSKGITYERGFFAGQGKPIYYLNMQTLEVSDYASAS